MAEPLEILCSSPSSPQIERSIPIETGTSSPGDENQQEICRICHCEETPDSPLISPCYCSGSMRYVHQSCLQQWIKSSCSQYCELCMFHFILETKFQPFWKWKNIDISTRERRHLYCSVAFIILTITGVVNWSRLAWSQYKPDIGLYWWIEVGITLVFFNIMVVLMCVQFKVFNKMFRKWKFFNSITYVQNAPERRRMFWHQRRPMIFSLTDLSTSNILHRDTCYSLSEEDLPRGPPNSNSNSHTGSNKSLDMDDAKGTPSKKSINDGSPKTILSCKKNKEFVPVEDHIHPLSEIVVIFTTNDSMSSTGHGGESSFTPESPAKQSTEISRQDDSKI